MWMRERRKRRSALLCGSLWPAVFTEISVEKTRVLYYNVDIRNADRFLNQYLGGRTDMAAVKELLRAENDGTLSFGDYTLAAKTKKDDYEFEGDIYKVKTFSEITKLERNGMFVYESVPGSAVENFKETAAEVSFDVSAQGDVQFTLELEPESEYEVFIDGESAGKMNTNLSGKLSVSVELTADQSKQVKVVKC